MPSTIKVLNVSGLTPLATPVNAIVNKVPLPVIGMLLHGIVIVSLPAVMVFTTGLSHAAARAPLDTVPGLTMAGSNVKLTETDSRPVTEPIVISTLTGGGPTILITTFGGRLTWTAEAAAAAVTT